MGFDSMADSSSGFESKAGFESEYVVGYGFALSVGSILGK